MTTNPKSSARLRAVNTTGTDDRLSDHYRYGIGAAGRGESATAWGFCSCGWLGERHLRWVPGEDAGRLIAAELGDHEAITDHRPTEGGVPVPDGYHASCGACHDFDDDCLVPPTSPAGRVQRAAVATSRDALLALDRLRAIQELRAWLDDQEAQAAIGCRMARATWAEMGEAIDSTRQAAFNRWAATIKRYESVGLIDEIDEIPERNDTAEGLAACQHGNTHPR